MLLLQAPKLHGLYRLDNKNKSNSTQLCLTAIDIHKKLGHISEKALRYLVNHGMVLGLELTNTRGKITCDACIKSKITRKPLPKESSERSKYIGDKIYSDVWGPSRHLTIDKKSYYISITEIIRENQSYT